MLTKNHEKALIWMRRFYMFMYETPIHWDPIQHRLSVNEEKHKWIFWWIGNIFVLSHLLITLYVLVTLPFIERQNFGVFRFCVLTTATCFYVVVLASAWGLTALRQSRFYIEALNDFINLEIKIYRKYHPDLLKPRRRMTMDEFLFLGGQFMNLIAYALFASCMAFQIDGMYWMLKDIAPSFINSPQFILLRVLVLIPGILETNRTMVYASLGSVGVLLYFKQLFDVLAFRVKGSADFFRYFNQLIIINNTLSTMIQRSFFLGVTIFCLLFVQNWCVCIFSWGKLDILIYMYFASCGLTQIIALGISIPIISASGHIMAETIKIKKQEIKRRCVMFKSFGIKVDVKRVNGLKPIVLSYGSCYPAGKQFARNTVDNIIQSLATAVIAFKGWK